jgi:shikimate kinase
MDSARSIALIGLPGSGKSTVGRFLAARLQWPFADVDAAIESEAGLTVAEIFERDGEPAFRRLESEALIRLCAGPASVVACGGGIVLNAGNRELLKRRLHTVWLRVEPGEAARRLEHEAESRPLLNGAPLPERLAGLLREREAWYRECAALEVHTDGVEPDEVVEPVLAFLSGVQ